MFPQSGNGGQKGQTLLKPSRFFFLFKIRLSISIFQHLTFESVVGAIAINNVHVGGTEKIIEFILFIDLITVEVYVIIFRAIWILILVGIGCSRVFQLPFPLPCTQLKIWDMPIRFRTGFKVNEKLFDERPLVFARLVLPSLNHP